MNPTKRQIRFAMIEIDDTTSYLVASQVRDNPQTWDVLPQKCGMTNGCAYLPMDVEANRQMTDVFDRQEVHNEP